MLRTMPAREWSGWVAFYSLEPFGPRQEDQRAAYTVQAWAGSKVDVTSLFPSLATKASGSATWKSGSMSRAHVVTLGDPWKKKRQLA
jgi:hypothetical protein